MLIFHFRQFTRARGTGNLLSYLSICPSPDGEPDSEPDGEPADVVISIRPLSIVVIGFSLQSYKKFVRFARKSTLIFRWSVVTKPILLVDRNNFVAIKSRQI